MPARSRRSLLAGVATLSVAAFAGCLGDDDGPDDAPDGARTVGLLVDIPQEEFMAIQQEIQEEVEEGELDEAEAGQEMQRRQMELIEAYVDELVVFVESDTDLVVEETLIEMGVVLVAGDADDIVATLDADIVAGILPEEDVQQPGGG